MKQYDVNEEVEVIISKVKDNGEIFGYLLTEMNVVRPRTFLVKVDEEFRDYYSVGDCSQANVEEIDRGRIITVSI